MSGFRPQLWPTLFTVPLVLLCVGLGVWQIQRLHWKLGLIAQRQAAVAAVLVAPPRNLAEAKALEFHPVATRGVFLNDKEIFVNAAGEGGHLGFHVLTPLRQEDGGIVFVNRGFIPAELKDPRTREAGEPAGEVRISGLLRVPPPGKPSWFTPANRPDIDYWFWIDLPAMAAADGLDEVAPFYIDADATPNPGGWPRGGVTPLQLPNNHLQYALTWFALAAAGVVIYLLSQRRGSGGR